MSFTQPQYITMSFAQDGDKAPIGDTPSLLQPSQPLGFPVLYSTPLDDGGEPITRAQFNGIMNLYSQFILWNNVGGTYSWNADIATTGYPLGAVIWYNNAQIRSTVANNTTEPSPSTVSVGETDWVYVAPFSEYQVPTGTIISMPTSAVPAGYLPCEGAEVSRATYANLFAVIGTTYGAGDGSATFRVPDFRAAFLRGHGIKNGARESEQFGVPQGDTLQDHQHISIPTPSENFFPVYAYGESPVPGGDKQTYGGSYDANLPYTSGVEIGNVGLETRPYNFAVLYCIKY
jgi:hypothetical protein